jgi:hypothetical protein
MSGMMCLRCRPTGQFQRMAQLNGVSARRWLAHSVGLLRSSTSRWRRMAQVQPACHAAQLARCFFLCPLALRIVVPVFYMRTLVFAHSTHTRFQSQLIQAGSGASTTRSLNQM